MIPANDALDLHFNKLDPTQTLIRLIATFRIELRNGTDPHLQLEYSPTSGWIKVLEHLIVRTPFLKMPNEIQALALAV